MNPFWEPLTKKEETVILILNQIRDGKQNVKIVLNFHEGKVATAFAKTSI